MVSLENRKNAAGAAESSELRKSDSALEPKGAQQDNASLSERFAAYFATHGFAAVAGIAALVLVGLGLTFWFVVFSGLAQSADFIYSQF